MATTGEKFLKVTHAEAFSITWHALRRLGECVGREVSEGTAYRLFCKGQHVRAWQMFLLGYRPRYAERLRHDEKSWYFRFELDGRELIAVLSEGADDREFVWKTTYSPSRQSDHFRVATFKQLSVAGWN